MNRSEPSVGRLLVLGAVALLMTTTLLWVGAGDAHPPSPVGDPLGWWAQTGTAAAAVSLVRGLGVVVGVWTTTLAAVGLLASTGHSRIARRVWSGIAPHALRRIVGAALVVGATAGPAAAAEADDIRVPVLRDLGAVEEPPPRPEPALLVDLGPMERTAAAPTVATTPTRGDRWTVTTGDHLWHIAAETLADRGTATEPADIARYWHRLIDRNRAAIGPDVDLIHPGLVLQLPD